MSRSGTAEISKVETISSLFITSPWLHSICRATVVPRESSAFYHTPSETIVMTRLASGPPDTRPPKHRAPVIPDRID